MLECVLILVFNFHLFPGYELFKQTKFSINGYLNPKVLNDRAIAHHLIPRDLNIHLC